MKRAQQISQPFLQEDYIEEESEIINKKFMELLQEKNQPSQESSESTLMFVGQDEQNEIRNRFRNICQGTQRANYMKFRQSLGLLGREDSFIRRIFQQIDKHQFGQICEEDYLAYIKTILYGNPFERERFGWGIISGKKGQLQLKDFLQLFEQISMVWNALTGQIIQPKRRYVQQLFNIFDIDEDDTITFQDYRVLSQVSPFLFGWFQYLNNMNINENQTKVELKKTKDLLHEKAFPTLQKQITDREQIKCLIQDQQGIIENKIVSLNKELQSVFQFTKGKLNNSKSMPFDEQDEEQTNPRISSFSRFSRFSRSSMNENHSTLSSSQQYMKSHIDQMSRIRKRKQKMQIESNRDTNVEVIKQLQKIMDRTYRIMNLCYQYHELKNIERNYSPSKIKLKEAKMQLVTSNKKLEEPEPVEEKKKKKKNVTVYFGHENWNLVLNLMVGLRKSIKSLFELHSYLQLKSSHFTEEHEFLLGNKFLNGKSKEIYKFVDIAPKVFEKLRDHYQVSNIQYQKSVGPEILLNSLIMGNLTALNEKCSTGKSGSFFYLTLDNKVFLKTIPKHQFVFFLQILENYYNHQKQYRNSLIVRIYGLYKLKVYENKDKIDTIYFISMENIFKNIVGDKSVKIEEIYDLKGSLYGRSGEEGKQLKDNDWLNKGRKIKLPESVRNSFKNQIKIDSKFFKHNNINDYSLMVAICTIDKSTWEKNKKSQGFQSNVFKSYRGGVLGREPGSFYILSIIDILTVFETKKNLEYIFKSTFLSKDVSCIPPSQYCKRFRQFMYEAVNQEQNS